MLIRIYFCVALLALGILIPIASAYSQSASVFTPSTLISDSYFSAKDAMDVSAIQRFLVSQNSILARLAPTALGVGANNRSAAQIIYDATRGVRTDFAHADGYSSAKPLVLSINPGVILATIQKEQALVTGHFSLTGAATNTALNAAMGYGCSESVKCSSNYTGFTRQVTYGAAQLARNFALAGSSHFPPGQIVILNNTTGGPDNPPATEKILIGNAATSALYQYTPHIYYGNKNFWSVTVAWFMQSSDTTNYLAQAHDTAVYYVSDGVRYRLRSAAQYSELKLSSQIIQSITLAALVQLPDGPPIGLPCYALGTNTLYLVTGGKKWRFTSQDDLINWGFTTDETEAVQPDLLAAIPTGGVISWLAADGSSLALVSNGKRYSISDPALLQAWGLQATIPVVLGSEMLNFLPTVASLSNLAQDASGQRYMLVHGQRLPVSSTDTPPILPPNLLERLPVVGDD